MIANLIVTPCFSEVDKKKEKRDDSFDTTSSELKSKYQTANGSIIMHHTIPNIYSGPVHGPGVCSGTMGTLLNIVWFEKDDNDNISVISRRKIPFSRVLAVDNPMPNEKRPDDILVYYQGPFGETEYCIYYDMEDNEVGKTYPEIFVEEWVEYLSAE